LSNPGGCTKFGRCCIQLGMPSIMNSRAAFRVFDMSGNVSALFVLHAFCRHHWQRCLSVRVPVYGKYARVASTQLAMPPIYEACQYLHRCYLRRAPGKKHCTESSAHSYYATTSCCGYPTSGCIRGTCCHQCATSSDKFSVFDTWKWQSHHNHASAL
jgi:hypothetical protein